MSKGCKASFANDASFGKTGFKNNARIETWEDDKIYLVAINDINVGDEIFTGNGKEYWQEYA